MSDASKINASHLRRRAFVYLRQSSAAQVEQPAGFLAVTLGTANALPAVAPLDHLVPANDRNIETVWWRRRWYRRHWRRWHRW